MSGLLQQAEVSCCGRQLQVMEVALLDRGLVHNQEGLPKRALACRVIVLAHILTSPSQGMLSQSVAGSTAVDAGWGLYVPTLSHN